MESLATVLFAISLLGCAQDFVPKPNDLGVKDFTPSDAPPAQPEDGGGDSGSDASVDDSAAPPDLTPVTCDLSPSMSDAGMVARLYLAAVTTGNALATASFTEADLWSAVSVDGTHGVAEVAVTVGPGKRPVVVARQNDSTLSYTVPQPCTNLFGALVPLYAGSATSNRPSLVGGATVDIAFRGTTNNNLYHSIFDGTSWSTGTQLALLTDQWPAAVRAGGVVDVVHTGSGATPTGQLYDAPLGSAPLAITNSTSAAGPAAVVTADGTIHVVFLGMDTNLYWTKRAPGGSTWLAPVQLCAGRSGCLDASDKQPLIALGSDGKPVVVWHGKTDNHLYTSTLSDGTVPPWSAAIEATGSDTTNSLPGIATGLGSSTAELVYLRSTDGAARHTRLTATWSTAVTIGSQTYTSTPALAAAN